MPLADRECVRVSPASAIRDCCNRRALESVVSVCTAPWDCRLLEKAISTLCDLLFRDPFFNSVLL